MASWRVRTAEHDRLVARVHELTATVESTVSVACFLNDATLAKEIATGLMKNRIVAGVRITSGTTPLYSLRRPARDARRDDASRALSTRRSTATTPVGEITLFVSHAEIEAQAIAYSRYTTWILGLQVSIVAAAVAFLVYLLVTRPIKGISDELHRLEIRSGMRLTVPSYRRTDEIGQLVMRRERADHAALRRARPPSATCARRRSSASGACAWCSRRPTRASWCSTKTARCNPAIRPSCESSARGRRRRARCSATCSRRTAPLVGGAHRRKPGSSEPRDADLEIDLRGPRQSLGGTVGESARPQPAAGRCSTTSPSASAPSPRRRSSPSRDTLTGLLNRRGFDAALGQPARRPSRGDAQLRLAAGRPRPLQGRQRHLRSRGRRPWCCAKSRGARASACAAPISWAASAATNSSMLLPGIEAPAQGGWRSPTNIIAGVSQPIDLGDGEFAQVGASIGISLAGPERETRRIAAAPGGRGHVRRQTGGPRPRLRRPCRRRHGLGETTPH